MNTAQGRQSSVSKGAPTRTVEGKTEQQQAVL